MRGEPLELVARETNVSIARLSEWRERALAGAATALKERERDDRDDEIARLKSKVGEITMDNELTVSLPCGWARADVRRQRVKYPHDRSSILGTRMLRKATKAQPARAQAP